MQKHFKPTPLTWHEILTVRIKTAFYMWKYLPNPKGTKCSTLPPPGQNLTQGITPFSVYMSVIWSEEEGQSQIHNMASKTVCISKYIALKV